nr:MAG TPA: hypothetical protein [Caudoviricetes sp.]
MRSTSVERIIWVFNDIGISTVVGMAESEVVLPLIFDHFTIVYILAF